MEGSGAEDGCLPPQTRRGLSSNQLLQLLARTTRSVSPTATGSALLKELAPALERIERSLAEARKQKERPAGRIRLIIPQTASYMILLPKLAEFARNYPEIVLEVTSSNDPVDLVAGEYDAGVQIGEFIQRDMIAVRVSKDMRLAVVGSAEYFKSRKVPRTPRDLKDHACIGFRFSSGIYRWEFEKRRQTITVNPQGPATFDHPDLVIRAVLDGVGIGTAMEESLTEMIAEGRLVQVLRDWCPTFPGVFSLLSKPPEPACRACGSDPDTAQDGMRAAGGPGPGCACHHSERLTFRGLLVLEGFDGVEPWRRGSRAGFRR